MLVSAVVQSRIVSRGLPSNLPTRASVRGGLPFCASPFSPHRSSLASGIRISRSNACFCVGLSCRRFKFTRNAYALRSAGLMFAHPFNTWVRVFAPRIS